MIAYTMKFLTILATVFCGGTVWVAADYYIELRSLAPVSVGGASSSRAQMSVTSMVVLLYECQGNPAESTAFRAAQSLCVPVTSMERKHNIYVSCNFYRVRRANSQSHVIHLLDRNLPSEWYLGYFNNEIDHPNFADPTQEDIEYFRSRVAQMGLDTIVPSYLVNGLAQYFSQSNLIAFSRNAVTANSLLNRFAALLKRIMDRYSRIDEEDRWSRANIKAQLDMAIKLCFQKMIDPCSVLQGNLQTFASQYCATYCNFLNLAARHFRTSTSWCNSLEGGQCVTGKCACTRVLNSFVGCTTSPMQLCHNYMREEKNV